MKEKTTKNYIDVADGYRLVVLDEIEKFGFDKGLLRDAERTK